MARARKSGTRAVTHKARLWFLRLYIANHNPRSQLALSNIQRLCRDHLDGNCRIQVIDLKRYPARARSAGIVAVPTLICTRPSGTLRMVGDLSDTPRVLRALGIGSTQWRSDPCT